jgi:hypothetical protein
MKGWDRQGPGGGTADAPATAGTASATDAPRGAARPTAGSTTAARSAGTASPSGEA